MNNQPSSYAVRAEQASKDMIAQANTNLENFCYNRGIKKSDLIRTMKSMNLKNYSPKRVTNYNPELKGAIVTTDLSELCLVAIMMDINPITLLIGDVKREKR